MRIGGKASCSVDDGSEKKESFFRGQNFSFTTPSGVNTMTSLFLISFATLAFAARLERLPRNGNAAGAMPRLFRISRRVSIVSTLGIVSRVVLFKKFLNMEH